tara:strand:- start:14 stop:766 length:753 start_codon:yes stop_codon:yes gene_type:complete
METSLYFKTALILATQLGIVFGGCFFFISSAKKAYMEGRLFFGIEFVGRKNSRGELDLIPIKQVPIIKAKEGGSTKKQTSLDKFLWVWMISLFGMIFLASGSTSIGLILMTISSVTFAPVLGVMMLQMDENDGLRATLLTCLITVGAGLIGTYSGIDFSFMRGFLFYGLCALLLIGFGRIFFGMTSAMIRLKAICGAVLFTLYLVYDFNRLKQFSDIGINDWSTALNVAISIYLDILNLLLEIMEAMGNS